jgi:opacity protein-like surface antigen
MTTKKIFLFFTACLIVESPSFGLTNNAEYPDDEQKLKRKKQIGVYGGFSFGHKITNAHGPHGGSSYGQSNESKVEGIVIEQNWAVGLNSRYYFSNYFGVDVDVMYSQAEFPKQQVSLNGWLINQPKSDLDFFTLSIGPNVRYKGNDIWQFLNPYASVGLSVVLGNASDVDLFPQYGKGGSSNLKGLGGNIRLGTQYELSNFGLSLEYRFEYLNIDVDHFRSFTNGINLNKYGSYLIISSYYHF